MHVGGWAHLAETLREDFTPQEAPQQSLQQGAANAFVGLQSAPHVQQHGVLHSSPGLL